LDFTFEWHKFKYVHNIEVVMRDCSLNLYTNEVMDLYVKIKEIFDDNVRRGNIDLKKSAGVDTILP
jgi:hypothetical protein